MAGRSARIPAPVDHADAMTVEDVVQVELAAEAFDRGTGGNPAQLVCHDPVPTGVSATTTRTWRI